VQIRHFVRGATMSDDEVARLRERYLDLLKRSLLGQTYFDNELRLLYLRRCVRGTERFDERVLHDIRSYQPGEVIRVATAMDVGFPIGTDLAELPYCYTMLGRKRLENVEHCVRTILDEKIPGDLVECGVWRGGSVTFMRGMLAAYGVTDRTVWVADSFEGLPAPVLAPDVALGVDLSREHFPSLAIDLETVQRALSAHGLLDEQVRFLKGWFSDTLPTAPIERLALLRVDGDLYSSTRDALGALYDRVSPGGFVVVDDYFLPCCKQAVDEFLVERQLGVPIERIDWTGVYFRKPG
jgi:O-methyltransferase